jgi:hypothetical protein
MEQRDLQVWIPLVLRRERARLPVMAIRKMDETRHPMTEIKRSIAYLFTDVPRISQRTVVKERNSHSPTRNCRIRLKTG